METGRMELRPAGEDRWELFLRETGEECGHCGMQKIQWNKKTMWQISWELTPEHLHQGYAAEAVRAVTDYAFPSRGWRKSAPWYRTPTSLALPPPCVAA